MKKRKHIFLFVPDGVGVKNYLYSRTFNNFDVELTLFHNFDDSTLQYISKSVAIDNSVIIPSYKEGVREKFLRELIHLCRLKHNTQKTHNQTIMDFWKRDHKSVKLKIFYRAVTLASNFYRSYKQILKLEKQYDNVIRKNPFYDKIIQLLRKNSPNVVFCTHQRALKAPIIFAAAKDLGIKTATVIYSWDNLPKARLALKADKYFVWSQYMKEELHFYYPEISFEKIKITGTPQFEFYNDPENIIEKKTFFKKYGLKEAKKLICFSGDDIKTSPFDPEYLNDIATAITEAGKQSEYQLIFRRCPVDVSGRYDWVLQKFPALIVDMPPLWNFNSDIWSTVYPTKEDIKLLVSLAFYTDAVVNVGSTMAFDFAMFGKPCLFINYDQNKKSTWSVKTIYNYPHFKSMPDKEVVFWLQDVSEIMTKLEKAASEKTTVQKWVNKIVGDDQNASENIKKELAS